MTRISPTLGAVALGTIAAIGLAVVLVVVPLPMADAGPTLLIPAVFVLAGLLGPIWGGAAFTCTAVALIGVLHLVAFAASAVALAGMPPTALWHAVSQALFVAGFGMFVPLAAGYPAGPAPRWSYLPLAAALAVPVLGTLSGPTPAVLDGEVVVGPIVSLLPGWIAEASGIVFLLPAAAVLVGLVRMARGGPALRRRLAWPIAALAALALAVAIGAAVADSAAGLATALFLVSSPLVPAGLIAGSRAAETGAEAAADARTLRRELRAIAARLDAATRALPGDRSGSGADVAAASRAPGVRPAHLPQDGSDDIRTRLSRLTEREAAVLALVAGGRSNRAVARELHVSLSAVEKHMNAIFQKLELPADLDTHRRVAASAAYLSIGPHGADEAAPPAVGRDRRRSDP
ncbi:helix-turn-helix transcriptional regulator [Agromyces sp. SYSU T0242]|uniref:helix-turn-helix transcriptional regulator n=1 Tax=Agromyces litoreus TaxID=3158561 RepID=UPI0033993EC8